MDCEHAVALLSARLDHEIQAEDRDLLDRHLRDCPACRSTADAFGLQHQELRGAFSPRRQAAAATAERVNDRLLAARVPTVGWRGRLVRTALVVGAVAAAVAVVVLTRGWFGPQPHTTASSTLKPLAISLTGPQQLTPRPQSAAPPATNLAVGESVETKAGEKLRLVLPDGSVLYVNEKTKLTLNENRQASLTLGTIYVEVAPRKPEADGSTFTIQTPKGPIKAFGTKFEVRADDRHGAAVMVAQGRITFDKMEVRAGQEVSEGIADKAVITDSTKLLAPVPAPRASHELDWTRDLMAAAESPLVPASAYDGGALVAVDPYGQEAKLNLRNYHIDVHVEDGFARTTIDQTYFNNTPWRLEGTFYFPLPPDASLSRLAMYTDGNLMEGGMTDRDYGSEVYEKVVRAKRDPALLEWVDGSTFKMRVFPLEGRQEKRIILSYTQRLPVLYGRTQYRFPAGHSLQVVDHWSFHALVKNGGARSWNSPTHPAMRGRRDGDDMVLDAADSACKVDRDVEVDMVDPQENNTNGERVRFSTAEQDGAGYLMLRFRPELPAAPQRQRRDWVFLYESSADRDPLLARAQIDIIRHMLEHVEHDDTFAVLTAGTTTHLFGDGPMPATPENTAAAVAWLERTHLIGALDLGRALADAAPLLQAGPNPYLVHIGSGLTAMGRRQEALADLIAPGVRYIGIGVGKHWGRNWMKERAEGSGGYFTQINPDEPIAWRAFDLISTLNTPRLLHVHVGPGDDAEQPRFLTDQALVAQGEEVCAVAQVVRNADGLLALPRSVVVTGVLDGQPYRREIPVQTLTPHADYLPRTWAKWEIDRLLAANAQENKEKVVELSKAMYVMTPFTSLLVLENEAMYKEFKVDRGRKDHWAMYPCPQTVPIVFEPDPTQPIDVRNAPKTPKPVANVVLPTIARRATLGFLNGVAEGEQDEKEELGKRLKSVTSLNLLLRVPSDPASVVGLIEHGGRAPRTGRVDVYDLSISAGIDILRRDGNFDQPGKVDALGLNQPLGNASAFQPPWSEAGEERRGTHRPANEEPEGLGFRSPVEFGLPGLSTPSHFGRALRGDLDSRAGTEAFGDFIELSPSTGRQYEKYALTADSAPRPLLPEPKLRTQPQFFRQRIESGWTPTLLYQSPSYSGDARLFSDLVSYAPGLNTSDADMRAVLDAEAAPNLADAPGRIDPDARRLIELSRRPHWRTLTVGEGATALQFHFDGAGRYVYEHTLPLGLHERVVCDGVTLWHLYPELGLAARRTVSRFHRAEIAGLTPWTLPPAEDLAHGADVEAVDAHTVALVPIGAKTRRTDDDKPAPYYRVLFVFADDGRLAERRLEEAPAGKVVLRETYDADGLVRTRNADGKEIGKTPHQVADAPAPDLTADVANLVVVRMPLRSRAWVFEDLNLDSSRPLFDEMNGCYVYLEGEQAVELLAGAMTEGNADEAVRTFRDCFDVHGDRRRGLFTLLAAAGVAVCKEPAFQAYLSDHKDDPLMRYFALLGNPAYETLHRDAGVDFGGRVGPTTGFLGRLAEFHDLEMRWQSGPSSWLDAALRRADQKRTFDFIRRNRDNVLGWAMQVHVQGRARYGDRLSLALAESWAVLAGDDPDAYAARYEQARCLFRGGKRDEARKLFLDLYAGTLKAGGLPRIDGDFRAALGDDGWNARMWKTANEFIDKKERSAVVTLAWQCRQVGDEPLSDNLLASALDRLPNGAENTETMLAAVEYLWQTDQLAAAEDVLNRLMADDPAHAKDAELWRLAAELAERRQKPPRAAECLETALDLEYRDLPSVIDLQTWRTDYGKLLGYYQSQATTWAYAHDVAPTDLAARTIQAADRWRAHDPEAAGACQTAAAILRVLGERDAAWEYLTTPAAFRADAVSWTGTAHDLGREGDAFLADRAFAAACEHDPDDALLVWQRAMAQRQAGGNADDLLNRLADGRWPEPYQGVQAQARWQLGRK